MRLAWFCLLMAMPTAAQPVVEHRSAETVSPQAVALANIVMPVETLVAVEMRSARADFRAFAAASPDFRRMERDFPGATSYVWKAVEPECRRLSLESHPALVSDMARIYASGLDSREIAAVTAFYQTPTGQRALAALYGDADFAKVAGVVRRAGRVTSDTQAAAYADSRALVASGVTPADRDALSALGRAVSPEKMRAVSEVLQQRILERANAAKPARDARLGKLSYEASKRWVEKSRPRR